MKCRQPKAAGVYLLGTAGFVPPKSTEYMEAACKVHENVAMHPFAFRVHTHSLGNFDSELMNLSSQILFDYLTIFVERTRSIWLSRATWSEWETRLDSNWEAKCKTSCMNEIIVIVA